MPRPRRKPRPPDAAGRGAPRLFLTPGEPAGIGPDLAVLAAGRRWPAELVAVADPALLAARARTLGRRLHLLPFEPESPPRPLPAGSLRVLPVPLAVPARAGRLDVRNADYVLATLRRAVRECRRGGRCALVTGPVQKSVIADAGHRFTGHTEYLARLTGARQPVMMLVAGRLRVALATTHLPLRAVPAAITRPGLVAVLEVLARDLTRRFGIRTPRIRVAGLNPHAGEGGHLGREEQDVIAPALRALRRRGLRVEGPVPADTLFTPDSLARADAVLALYHDQGLPVLKHAGFGEAVNVTLGLPIVRTSVDHGTALDLAGGGAADPGSLFAALGLAARLARRA